MCGFIAQLVEQRTGNAEVTGSNPVEALSNSCLPYLRLTAKNFQFLRLSTKFLAVLRLSVNPIETLTIVSCRLCHAIYYLFYKKKKKLKLPITSIEFLNLWSTLKLFRNSCRLLEQFETLKAI